MTHIPYSENGPLTVEQLSVLASLSPQQLSTLAKVPLPKLERILWEEEFADEHREIFERLTDTQLEILRLICKGLTSKDIAECRKVAEGTIRKHRNNIYEILDIHNSVEAMEFALAFDLL